MDRSDCLGYFYFFFCSMSVRKAKPDKEVQYHKSIKMPLYRPVQRQGRHFVSVEFEGCSWGKLFLIAPGVIENLISREAYEQIPPSHRPLLLPPDSPISASAGDHMKILGQCDLKFRINLHSFTYRFYVVEDLAENTLGARFIVKFHINTGNTRESVYYGENPLNTYDINGQQIYP